MNEPETHKIIERIARALAISSGVTDTNMLCTRMAIAEYGSLKVIPREDFIAPAWRFFIDDAITIIKIMREPTDEMIKAGNNYCPGDADEVFKSMIDEILK